jgi:hypothetical protein
MARQCTHLPLSGRLTPPVTATRNTVDMTTSSRPRVESPEAAVRAAGYQPAPMVHDRWGQSWWGIVQDDAGRWSLLTVRDSTYDSADPYGWDPYEFTRIHPPVPPSADVTDVIREILSRPRNTVVRAEFECRAVNRYLDNLPADEDDALSRQLSAAEPDGWARLEGLRCYDTNIGVRGRQSEAVSLLKTTLRQLWPLAMTDGRLTQSGKRHAMRRSWSIPITPGPTRLSTT